MYELQKVECVEYFEGLDRCIRCCKFKYKNQEVRKTKYCDTQF